MLTIAYIGNGKSTNRYHLPFATKLSVINPRKNNRFPSDSRYLGKTSWNDLHKDINDIYDDPAIQLVVVVTTPNHLHFETAKDALLHGKNVLLEKPFTETYAQAQELFALAAEKGLLINVIKIAATILTF